jgi:LuxR family transcriptional regulator, positive regulator of biofilm formation
MPDSVTQPRQAGTDRRVVIVGRHSLQLRLLTEMVSERLGCACELRAPAELETPLPPAALFLMDLESIPAKQLGAHVSALVAGAPERQLVLFNVDDMAALQHIVQLPGVRGVLSRDASQEHLLRGVTAVLAGEYWLPRKVLAAHLEQSRARRLLSGANGVALTPKETETLRLLMRGGSNSRIAGELRVSTHTVKTHLYNLFRKLQVSNRVQAAQWAMNHIEQIDRSR